VYCNSDKRRFIIATFTKQIRIPIEVGEEQVILICRKPTADEVNQFLSARFVAKGRKVEQHFVQERVKFIDKILIGVENAGYENAQGELVVLAAEAVLSDADKAYASESLGFPVTSWKDLINVNWKCAAAIRFEEPPTDEAEKSAKN
jgi:hypothetical protein